MFLIVTRASAKIGYGHLCRTLYLASLLKRDAKILFFTSKDKEALKMINEKGFSYSLNISDVKIQEVSSVLFDLKVFREEDIQLLEELMSKKVKIYQICDMGLGKQEKVIYFDSSMLSKEKFCNENSFCGPDYAILHHRMRHFNKVERKYSLKPRKVFISLGGGVEYRTMKKYIDIFYNLGYKLKIAKGFNIKSSIANKLKLKYKGIKYVGKVESLARPLFEADIAFITPGVTAYECAAVGTPAMYISLNSDQLQAAKIMESLGWGVCCGMADKVNIKDIARFVDIFKDFDFRLNMGRKAKKEVDGLGAYRIIHKLKEGVKEWKKTKKLMF